MLFLHWLAFPLSKLILNYNYILSHVNTRVVSKVQALLGYTSFLFKYISRSGLLAFACKICVKGKNKRPCSLFPTGLGIKVILVSKNEPRLISFFSVLWNSLNINWEYLFFPGLEESACKTVRTWCFGIFSWSGEDGQRGWYFKLFHFNDDSRISFWSCNPIDIIFVIPSSNFR